MPVKIVASTIEPTRRVPVQGFSENGQTEDLQTGQAEQAEEFEKESRFEYLANDLSHELKAIKSSVATMGERHEK